MSLKDEIVWACGADIHATKEGASDSALLPVEALRAWLEDRMDGRLWNIYDEAQRSGYQRLLSELEGIA